MRKRPSIADLIRETVKSANEVTDLRRRLEEARDEADHPYTGSTFRDRLLHELRAAGRGMRRELKYAFVVPLRLLLIAVFNVVGLLLLVWLLSVL